MGVIPRESDEARLNAGYDGPWQNMILVNGFTAVAGFTPQYMKDSRGRVFVRGRVTAPGGVGVFWNPPAGFLPVRLGQYFDWGTGGSDVAAPSTMCSIDATGFSGGWTNAAVAPVIGTVVDMARSSWSTL